MNFIKIINTNKAINILSLINIFALFVFMPIVEKKFYIFSQFIAQIVILLSILYYCFFYSGNKFNISLSILELIFLPLLPIFLISSIAHENKYQMFLISYDIFIFCSLLLLINKIFTKDNLMFFYNGIILSALLLSVISIFNKFNKLSDFGFFNYNLGAMYIFIGIIYVINYLMKTNASIIKKIIYVISLTLMIIAEVLLSSRSIYLITSLITLILIINLIIKRKIKLILIIVFILILLFSLIGLIYKFSISGYKWERLKIWETSLRILKDNIWLGVGPGNFQYIAYKYNFETYDSPARYGLYPNHAHNQWLNIICETGFLSILIIVTFIFYIIYIYEKHVIKGNKLTINALAFISLILFGFVNNFFDSYALSFLFIFLLFIFQKEMEIKKYSFSFNLHKINKIIFALFILVAIIFYSLFPYLAHIYYEKSLRLLNKGKIIEAKAAIIKAIKFVPNFSKYYKLKANIEIQEFNINQNINILPSIMHNYEIAEHLNSKDFLIKKDKASFYIFLSSYFSTKEFIYNAISCYESVIENNPFNPFYYYHLSECYGILFDYDKAISMLEKAIKLEPNYINAYFKLSEFYNLKNDKQKAQFYLEKGKGLVLKYWNREKSSNQYLNNLLSVSPEYYYLINK